MQIHAQKATLIKRYKRFLADVTLEDGTETTIHVANTGAMTGCATSGDTIYYSVSGNKKRKYPFSWELSQTKEQHWICVNTIRANQLVEEALINQKISELKNFTDLKREVKYGNEGSKVDFHLIDEQGKATFIEVKSVTLLEKQQGYFPDAKTERGQKHLRELIEVVEQGNRAVLFFAVLHSGINSVKAAAHIDEKYAHLLQLARQKGVEVIAYQAHFDNKLEGINITLENPLSVK
ncbi:DNA/RNA nuclease SfsA [Thalassotalea castellviae]|uniref:Sugar fermentation stimulation protein homolog n=1 Tax=Thalassotalea castellviae TaxID=3075612 RepID=A0ABU3A4M0_9GAMM|nr:DNA/RNA nuclease SfsA [Thalassotalea sp. W431]MDT0605124.1 DNA/RNA nuclease SfsA [Thalassotalea sp. W431]